MSLTLAHLRICLSNCMDVSEGRIALHHRQARSSISEHADVHGESLLFISVDFMILQCFCRCISEFFSYRLVF